MLRSYGIRLELLVGEYDPSVLVMMMMVVVVDYISVVLSCGLLVFTSMLY